MHLNAPFCYNGAMQVTLISNGHGEDLIAATLISAIKKEHPDTHFDVVALVGKGHSFTSVDLTPKLSNPDFPSAGFIRTLGDLYRDLRAGILGHILKQRKIIKESMEHSDYVIAVGDVFCLWQARNNKNVPTYFLPTAKSDTFMPHSGLEKWFMKRHCTTVFPRDEMTNESLNRAGLPSYFFGNVMMDGLITKGPLGKNPHPSPLPGERETEPMLTLGVLPGSREEAFENLGHIVKILEHVRTKANMYVALSPALDQKKAHAILKGTHIKVTTEFKALINQADVIIGLAGTANEQAAYLDVTVICFPGFGPQSTQQRFEEQAKLMGENIHFYNTQNPKELAQEIDRCLSKKRVKVLPKKGNAAEIIVKEMIEN